MSNNDNQCGLPPTVNIADLKSIFNFVDLATNNGSRRLPVWIWGKRGVGKSQIVQDYFGLEKGYKVVVLNLANQTIEELLGQPNFEEHRGFYKPDWLMDDCEEKVVYYLDEINRAAPHILQAMFNFIYEGRIHTHKIKDNDIIIAAGNMANADYTVTDFCDQAFYSRFVHLYLSPSNNECLDYLSERGYDRTFISYLEMNGSEMFDNSITDSDKINIGPDNRSMETIGRVVNIIKSSSMTKEEKLNTIRQEGQLIFAGLIGQQLAGPLVQKLTDDIFREISMDELLKCKTVEDFERVIDMDEIGLVNNATVKVLNWLKENYKPKEKPFDKMKKSQKEWINTFVDSIPKDTSRSFVAKIYNDYKEEGGCSPSETLFALFGMEKVREYYKYVQNETAEANSETDSE